jgi:imidazolonepropionase-like amidohydrolase
MIEGAWWLDRVTQAFKTTPVLASFPFMELTPRYRLAGPGDAGRALGVATAGGVDLVKFRNLRGDEFAAVAMEAKRLGLPLAGHAPQGVSPGAAAEAGLGSIEHMETVSLRLEKAPEAERRREFERVARAGGMITPTLMADVTYRQTADERGYSIIADTANRIDPRRRYLSPGALASWRFGLDIKKLEGPGRNSAALHTLQIADVRLARDAGVPAADRNRHHRPAHLPRLFGP